MCRVHSHSQKENPHSWNLQTPGTFRFPPLPDGEGARARAFPLPCWTGIGPLPRNSCLASLSFPKPWAVRSSLSLGCWFSVASCFRTEPRVFKRPNGDLGAHCWIVPWGWSSLANLSSLCLPAFCMSCYTWWEEKGKNLWTPSCLDQNIPLKFCICTD